MLLNAMESEFPGCRYELFTSTLSISNIRLYRSAGYAECGRKRISDMPEFVYLKKTNGKR